MNNLICDVCGARMKKNGKTSAGAQRWRCTKCGASITHHIDNSAKQLKAFLRWLMGKETVGGATSSSKATFERRAEKFWRLWPLSEYTGEVFDVVFVDGIYVTDSLVVLIACTHEHVLAWHLAQSECSEAWAALLLKVAPPAMVVSDGGTGFAKAVRAIWPHTRVQRCLVHIKRQVQRKTTLHPKLECGKELLEIAGALVKVKDADAAALWLASYAAWCARWEKFLREFTLKDGRRQYVHERIRSARHSLNKLIKQGTMFTFIEMAEERGGVWDATNNVIEGGVNAQIRLMLLYHRGLTTLRRVKAVFWWCYLHSEFKVSEAQMLKKLPTDDEAQGLFALASKPKVRSDGAPAEYGQQIPEWGDMKMRGSKETGWF